MTTSTQISANPRTKESRLSGDGDRLTFLHESVLSCILSRLPTEDAIRTSILSKSWEYKWASSYNVDIHFKEWKSQLNMDAFTNLMDRILDVSQNLKTFTYRNYRITGRMEEWISRVLRDNPVECFQVRCGDSIVLPCNLLNSSSMLITLKVMTSNISTLNLVDAKNCVPNLTSLYLEGVDIVNGDPNTSTIKFTFPVLEKLRLGMCKWLNVETVEIYAPSLATFTSGTVNYVEQYDYSILIVAPRLTTIACIDGLPENIVLNGSSVVAAYLHCLGYTHDPRILSNIGLHVRNLLNRCTSLEKLEMSETIAEASQLGPPLLRHDKLRRLSLIQPCNAEQLFELLHAAPSLKYLGVNLYRWKDYDYEAMESIPSCIVSHLEEVEFSYFTRKTSKYNLIKFILKKAERLQKFCIGGYKDAKRLEERLSKFPKSSAALKIVVGKWEGLTTHIL